MCRKSHNRTILLWLLHRNRWLHDISVDDRIEFPIVLSRLLNVYIHQFLHFRFHLFSYMPLYEAHLLFRICLFCIYFDFVLGNSKKIRLQCFWLPSLNHHRLTLIIRMNPAPSLRGGRKGEGGVGELNPYDWYSDYFMENACERFFILTSEFSYTYERVQSVFGRWDFLVVWYLLDKFISHKWGDEKP